jgi:putative oxidoreductase
MPKNPHVESTDNGRPDDACRPRRHPVYAVTRRLSAGTIAAIFIQSGISVFREPGERHRAAAKLGLPQPELLVRLNAAGMAVAGVALAIGIKPRLSALTLAGLLVPTTLGGHRFWEEESEQGRRAQRTQFLKNLAMFGGLLLFATTPRRARRCVNGSD